MVRLLLTTEGQTEQAFVASVLTPHLAKLDIFVPNPRCTAIGRKAGRVHRGGVFQYQPMREDIRAWIKQDKDPDAHFSTMIDLYGIPSDFPGLDKARNTADPYHRVSILEEEFAKDIDSHRFIPYIQLHEFEALLLADPSKLCEYYPGRQEDVAPLEQALADAENNPELINDGTNTAPSKRIADCLPEYAFAKRTAGPIVAQSIGLATLRQACHHFNEWLEKLEALRKQAAPES